MLSNPTNGLHARQRQHRRQNSTPNAFQGVKTPNLPNTTHRQTAGHRRGMSLDIRRQNSTSSASRQEYMVSTNTNNTGLASHPQHQILREAQQQRTQARPGPQQQQQQHHYAALSGSENYLISPHGTPQAQRFDPSCFDPSSIPFDAYGGDLNMMMGKGQSGYGDNMSGGKDFDLFNTDSALSTPTFVNFQDSPTGQGWSSEGDTSSTRRTSRRVSNGIMDRVSKFENMGMDNLQRPVTPPTQDETTYYPPTPMETPHDRLVKQDSRPNRFSEGYDESMEETIKPVRGRSSNNRAQNIFQDIRQQTEQQGNPSPPRSNPLPQAETFHGVPLQTPDFMNMNNFNSEFLKIQSNFERDPAGLDVNQQMAQQSTPDAHMGQFVGGYGNKPDLQPYPLTAQTLAASQADSSSRRGSPHRRNESLASIASAASIASINIEETKTDTGVTLEEISQYISGPDAVDGKWMCIYEDCNKKFGRKENIKSHVQTHLNDRQYQCPTCQKCFVRQHDLKRHAKIHTGIKPYPCECGNSFARHDALTRHRQRGMCIGAFDGIVRKVVKRGRPKKNRPDMEARLEKSSRTRKKNMSISSMSSLSGYSDSSAVNSPDNDFNMLDDMIDMGGMDNSQSMAAVSSAPMGSTISAPINKSVSSSPSAVSAHSYVSPEAIMDGTPMNPTSPAKSIASQYNTPPELSQSSSPPATQFFDVDPNTSLGTDELSNLSGTSAIMNFASMTGTMPLGMSDPDDDILLQSANDEGLVQLDRDPSMLMMSKFDEEFDNAVGMFTNDDVFFGSS